MGSPLVPMVRFYQILFYPVAKPSAMLLDPWPGREGISLLRERDLHTVIRKHFESGAFEVGAIEGAGAISFLELDDVAVGEAGQPVDTASIPSLPHDGGHPPFPDFDATRPTRFCSASAARDASGPPSSTNKNDPRWR